MIAGVSTPPGTPSYMPWIEPWSASATITQERLHLRLHERSLLKRQPDVVVDAARLEQQTMQSGFGFVPVDRDDSRHGRMLADLNRGGAADGIAYRDGAGHIELAFEGTTAGRILTLLKPAQGFERHLPEEIPPLAQFYSAYRPDKKV